ncbi:MAG: outer membrane beta-barrel protein [Bryobacteraceae bacterium]
MRYLAFLLLSGAMTVLPVMGQRYEFGAGGGGSFYSNRALTGGPTNAKAGFQPGFAATAYIGHNMYRLVSGEFRYTFEQNEMRLSSGTTKATFGGRSHMLHYDIVVHAASSEAHVRPYVLAGAGFKDFQGTGTETLYQDLQSVALLTKTSQWQPLVTFGAGIKVAVSKGVFLRLEFRDYMTKLPNSVIAPVPPTIAGGWIHNFLPLIGISFAF